MTRSLRYLTINRDAYECGTRAKYVTGCRCDACRASNRDYYRERMTKMREAAGEVEPSGPPIPGTLKRGGRDVRILRCPGANGTVCVRGGAWLRGGDVCSACVERATVWNGLVSAARVKRKLRKLSSIGVGYKSVAAACDVAPSCLAGVSNGTITRIRAATERRVLAVDAGAMAGGAIVDAGDANTLIAKMRERGFTLRELGRLLGYDGAGSQVLQLGKKPTMLLATRMRVERLWRRIEREGLKPTSTLATREETRAAYAKLAAFAEVGLTAQWLSKRLGFHVHAKEPRRMFRKNLVAVLAFCEEIETRRREGDGLPADWAFTAGGVTQAWGFDGGWSHERRQSKAAKKREERELRKLARGVE